MDAFTGHQRQDLAAAEAALHVPSPANS